MKRSSLKTLLLLLIICLQSCTGGDDGTRAIYYWKKHFILSEYETEFLKSHDISRIYLRFFDVVTKTDSTDFHTEVHPASTVVFDSPFPDGIEIIPVVFISQKALRSYDDMRDLSQKIISRIDAMCLGSGLGKTREIQFDCDWTQSTEEKYFELCKASRHSLNRKGATLSGTIRLHQASLQHFPFEKGVMMVYNTGSVSDTSTNAILSPAVVRDYIEGRKRINCKEVSYAWSVFSWGLRYSPFGDSGKLVFREIIHDGHVLGSHIHENFYRDGNSVIYINRSDIDSVLLAKDIVKRNCGSRVHGGVLFHLDSLSLSRYTHDEIEALYN